MKTTHLLRCVPLLSLLLAVAGCTAHIPPERRFEGGSAWSGSLAGEVRVEVIPLVTGEVQVERGLLLDLGNGALADRTDRKTWVPVLAWLVRHPTEGDLLIDSGFDASFSRSGHGNFGGLARFVDIGRQHPGHDTAALLRGLGVDPARLKRILLSHLHSDHTAGLPGLPRNVPLLAGPGATAGYETMWYAPYDHLAGVEEIQTLDLTRAGESALGPAVDLFGDGSVVIVSTPGHAAGNLSFLLRARGGPVLLTCDASHTHEGFEQGVAPGKVADRAAADTSLARLRTFIAANPEVRVFAGHDARGFDMARGAQEPL
jgi:glyoxylase-like metal-dependent hydrolase (beta-lactamase superfamily II)